MTDPHQTLEDIAQAFGLLGQPPYVSVLAQQHALAKTGEQVLTLPALVQQQQALLPRLLARQATASHAAPPRTGCEEEPHG